MPRTEAGAPMNDGPMARLVIDTDVPARVERVSGSFELRLHRREVRELLCDTTPCTVSLPLGDHELLFSGVADAGRRSSTIVHLRRRSEVVNHTLGVERSSVGARAGVFTALVGLGLVVASFALPSKHGPSDTQKWLAGAGLLGVIGGLTFTAIHPATHQEGATRQWSPAEEPRLNAHGVGLGGTF